MKGNSIFWLGEGITGIIQRAVAILEKEMD